MFGEEDFKQLHWGQKKRHDGARTVRFHDHSGTRGNLLASKQNLDAPTLEQYLTTLHPVQALNFKPSSPPPSPASPPPSLSVRKHHSHVSVNLAESRTVIRGRWILKISSPAAMDFVVKRPVPAEGAGRGWMCGGRKEVL